MLSETIYHLADDPNVILATAQRSNAGYEIHVFASSVLREGNPLFDVVKQTLGNHGVISQRSDTFADIEMFGTCLWRGYDVSADCAAGSEGCPLCDAVPAIPAAVAA